MARSMVVWLSEGGSGELEEEGEEEDCVGGI
jgi:hypothetical protein